MRRIMLLVAIYVMTATALLLPVKKHEVEALAENLWTSDGWLNTQTPPNGWPVHRWERREYGLKWAWLVVDSGISCDDWYAKVDPIYFLFWPFRDLCVIFFVASFVASFVDPIFTARDRHFSAELTPTLTWLNCLLHRLDYD